MTNIVTSKTRNTHAGRSQSQGKGGWRRKTQVDAGTFADNWARTFGKAPKKTQKSRNGRKAAD